MAETRSGRPWVPLAGLIWLLVAVIVSAAGLLESLRPPAPQLILVGLTIVLVAAGTQVPTLRAWCESVNLRWVVALHLSRFVGFAFLELYRRGELPFAFAVPGGIGDIVVAAGALGILALGTPDTPGRRRLYVLWNLVGLLDILFVVVTAARLAFADPASMAALLRLPLSLLPTFLVPVIIASHLLLAVRLARPAGAQSP